MQTHKTAKILWKGEWELALCRSDLPDTREECEVSLERQETV